MHTSALVILAIQSAMAISRFDLPMEHCLTDTSRSRRFRRHFPECPSSTDLAADPWNILQAPESFGQQFNETQGKSCLTSIRRFRTNNDRRTTSSSSLSAIFLNFKWSAVWIVLDNAVDHFDAEWPMKVQPSIMHFNGEQMTSSQPLDTLEMRKQLGNGVIRRLDYIQMEAQSNCNQETGTEPIVTEQTTESTESSTIVSTTDQRPDDEFTSTNTDEIIVPTDPTQPTTVAPNPVQEPVIDTRIIGYFISFAVVLCALWFIWILILSIQRPRRQPQNNYPKLSVNVRTLPILIVQNTVLGRTEIVGYKV